MVTGFTRFLTKMMRNITPTLRLQAHHSSLQSVNNTIQQNIMKELTTEQQTQLASHNSQQYPTTDIAQPRQDPPLNKKQRAALRREQNKQTVNTLVSSIVNPTSTPETKTTLSPALSTQFGAINAKRAEAREFLNVTHAAEGLLVIINNEDNTVTYGFEDLRVWVPRTQSWDLLTANDPDKFMVTAETHALASSEFYNRWRTFTQQVYKTRIFITAINR